MRLGRRFVAFRRGGWLVIGLGPFGLVVGWGTWGDFKRAFGVHEDGECPPPAERVG